MADDFRKIDREILATGEVHQQEVEFRFQGGRSRSFLFTRAPFFGPDRTIRGIVGTMTEIPPLRRTGA